ncbi:hypothetical protein [Streptomyces sp. NPDC001816]|uniref:hypothetical protein n=1 Tax=Streptomyces sp. NPDC001816 TaxID=3364612 RepID=UPI0036AAA2DE
MLLRLLRHDDRDVRRFVTQRRDLPLQVVDAILADPDPALRTDFAESANADPAQRARLIDDPSPKVALVLAVGPMPQRGRVEPLPDRAYTRLLEHPPEHIRHEAVASPAVPAHILADLANHTDAFFRRASCRAWDRLPEATREALLQDDDLDVRRAAALSVSHEDTDRTAWPAENLKDSWRMSEVLQIGRLRRELAEQQVAGPHPAAVAANPSPRPDPVRQLAIHPDPHVRVGVSARWELTEPERAAIDYTLGPDARLDTLD